MSATSFKAGGALTDEHAAIYVERKADNEVLSHLRRMNYLLIIEPRQQGKTSLINHLMRHPALNNVAFAYIDVTTPNRSAEAAWYQTLCPRILRQLRGFIPREQWPATPQNSAGWRDFLWNVAASATDAHRRVVIALDEIGAVTFSGATDFFSVLRDVYNSRQAETEFKQLTFLLAGAFHPRDLIKDDKISPFNIAQRVRLADFTLAQVHELVGKGDWTDEQVTALSGRIHHWTDGQPYLTQLLCSYLGPEATPADVDAGVERLRREDENHLPPLMDRLASDEKMHRYVERILAGERIKFYPRENRRQAQLELLGVIKENADGFCVIRNRIYERVLAGETKPPLVIPSGFESPAAPNGRTKPTVVSPIPRSSVGGKNMDYKRGLDAFKQLSEGAEWYQDFTVHEAALRDNLRDERRYGPSEQTRRDRTRIVDQLNALALEHLGISFNDLCLGQSPLPQHATEAKGDGAPTGPGPLYGTGNRWAVLVGVNEYEDKANYGRLSVCVKDVHAVRNQLVAAGFDPARIRLLTDATPELPTREDILTTLQAVADATEPDDLLLFYYSGHGDEDDGESYLVARNGRRLVLRDTAVPLSRVREIMENAPARAKVIILDACHSGADIGGKGPQPMTAEFIRRVFEEAEGLAVLASCKQDQLSYEWRESERSVFTHFLLEALRGEADRDGKGFVTVQDTNRHVTNGVKLWASQHNLRQTPTLEGKLAGDIILAEYRSRTQPVDPSGKR